jgi:hypothetical protein
MTTVAEHLPIDTTGRKPGRRLLGRPGVWSALAAAAAELAPMLDSEHTVVRAWTAPSASYRHPAFPS